MVSSQHHLDGVETPMHDDAHSMHSDVASSVESHTHDVEKAAEAPAPPPAPAAMAYDNPMHWSEAKKLLNVAVLALMTLALTFSSSAYTSSAAHLMEELAISREVVLVGVALFVLGFATGPLIFGPLAHLVGHRPVYIATYIAFTAFLIGVGEAPNVGALLAFRFLAGMFGSSSLNNAGASIGAMVTPGRGNGKMLAYALAAFGGPGLGPLIGAFVDTRAGWRWNMRVQAIFAAVTTVLCVVCLSETNHAVLQKRAAGKLPTSPVATYPPPSISKLIKTVLCGPFVWLFTEPVVMVICLYLSLLYAVLYLTFVVVPLAFVGRRHYGPEPNGLIFISLLVGFAIGAALTFTLQTRHVKQVLAKGQPLTPEVRLRQAIWAAALPPAGLFLFGLTAPFAHVHWIAPCIGLALFTAGMLISFTSFIPYLVDYGGLHAPLLLAASTFTRSLLGAAFPLFATQMFSAMTIQGGCSMLGGVALLMAPLPLLLTRYGPKLRAMSRQAKA